MKNKSLIIKILVPILIVAVILAIFFIKRAHDSDTNIPSEPTVSDTTNSDGESKNFPLKVTSVNLEEIKKYGVPTVIDFGSDSCIPCKEMAPVLETLNKEFQGKAAVQFMDVWKYTGGVQDFPVQVIPTQVFFTADGKPFQPSEELASKIQFNQYTYKDTGELAFTVHQGGITEADMRLIFAEMGVE